MQEAIRFLRTRIPPGSWVVTDKGTGDMLAYYLPYDVKPVLFDSYRVWECGGLKFLTSREFHFTSDQDLRTTIQIFRNNFSWRGPVWVIYGGFTLNITNSAASTQPFQQAVALFETD